MFDSVHYEMQDTHIILIPDGEFVGCARSSCILFFKLVECNTGPIIQSSISMASTLHMDG